jgi:hypothetical protein
MGDVVFVIVIGAIAAAAGIALGIFIIAPRITRAQDRAHEDHPDDADQEAPSADEETGDRPD